MNSRNILNPIVRAIPTVAMSRQLSRAASATGLSLFRRKRRERPTLLIAAGVALAAAAAAALITPKSRKGITALLQRSGGGIGKQVGKLLGAQVGAHPKQTAKLVQNARDLVGSSEHVS